MNDRFKIYVEQLRDGHEEAIDEVFGPEFLGVFEPDLAFEAPIRLRGAACLAERELVLHWNVQTEAVVPCSICNEPVHVPIEIKNFYFSEPLESIKSGLYDFEPLLRETLLLEAPSFAECRGGCPKRREYDHYLKGPSASPSGEDEEGYHPFADVDWKL